MFMKEIEAAYTAKVAEYIAKGYTIYTATMRGHQGEIAKVDLRKGDEIIRILLHEEHDYRNMTESVVIMVGRCMDQYVIAGQSDTLWNDRLEAIERIVFFQIGEKWNGHKTIKVYTTSESVKDEAQAKRNARAKNRSHYTFYGKTMSEAAHAVVLPFVKRQPGCKTCKLSEIERVYKLTDSDGKTSYRVVARNKTYILH